MITPKPAMKKFDPINGTGDQVSTIGEGVIEKKKHDDYLYYHSSGQKPKSRPRSNSVR